MNTILAHLTIDDRGQTLAQHAKGTAELCEEFAAVFGAGPYAREMALAHDAGKQSDAFQRYLRRAAQNPRQKMHGPDHSTAGAQFLMRAGMAHAALCVAGHHAGLPDVGNARTDTGDSSTFCGRMKRTDLPDAGAWLRENEIQKRQPPILPPDGIHQSFLVRMLFSCLTDADFLDTEAFMQGASPRGDAYEPLTALWEKLQEKIAPWLSADRQPLPAAPGPRRTAELNRRRNAILRDCIAAGKGAKGLYTLTVPTGGGKTVASMAFALQHAATHPEIRRIIYVIPFTSITEQNAGVFRSLLGAENILEHHSGVCYDAAETEGTESETALKWRLASENWDAPIVVTTNVQFFESLYAAKSSRCRKLHNIAGSVVIFDEAQQLPLEYLRPCVRGIQELVKTYGVTAVLCTATQPALAPLFAPDCQPQEIIPDAAAQYTAFRRSRLENIGTQSLEQIAARMAERGQALAIVNTRKEAQQLYELLPQGARFHLSTLMTPEDRRQTLRAIRAALAAGKPCLVAATSLIEAGIDLDTPAVFREEAGLDSILQAAGRCNREGRRPADESVTSIFSTGQKPPRAVAQYVQLTRETAARYPDLGAPEAVDAYFRALHALKGEALDSNGILDKLENGLCGGGMPLRWVGEHFHLIDSTMMQVLVPESEQAQEIARQLQRGVLNRKLLRRAAQWTVSVYPQHFAALLRTGAEAITPDLAVLTDLSLYKASTGLTLEPEEGCAFMI
jgi:CRISPR-associated endonuclease/helicase Cas3